MMRILASIRFAGSAFMLVFAAACVRSRFSEGRYGVVTDMDRFMREACGPYASSLQGDPPVGLYPVRDALSSRMASIQKCYESLFYRSLDLPQGCVAIRFTIDHERRIRSMRTVWNTTGTALVSKCVQDVARDVGVIQNARPGEYVQAVIFAVGR
jgi:hypothetical protein